MDRRQKKTRQAVYRSFTALLETKPYSAISVQEIIDGADVGRSTFYAHFETKDALLESLCQEIFDHVFSNELTSEASHDFSDRARDLRAELTHILSNEKYCGDVIYQKTYTPSYIKHKSKRNKGVLRKWQWTGRHTAIVDKEIWNKAQELLESGTWRKNRATPLVREKGFVITRVRSGKLAGFYLLDPAWNKEEREKFLDIVKAEIQENSNSERNYNNERF
jgi:AcrR family transcriptional regulator